MDFIDGRAIMSKFGPWSVAIGLPKHAEVKWNLKYVDQI